MTKINNIVFIMTIMTMFTSFSSYSKIGEKEWNFKKDEVQHIYFEREGAEYECEKFFPSQVSYEVKVVGGNRNEFGWMEINGEASEEKNYVFNNVSKVGVGFFSGIKYQFKNITGVDVKGTNCAVGLIN